MEEFDHKITTFGIRNRILIFALVVALIPSLSLGWAFHTQTQKLLQEKVELELHSIINSAQREAGLWFKEHTVNMRVFSNSFVISENLEQFANLNKREESNTTEQMATTIAILSEYLMLVQSQFQEYKQLLLLDDTGKVIAQNSKNNTPFTLPDNWEEQLAQHKMIIGETDASGASTEATFLLAIPVFSHKQVFLGLLATETSLNGLQSVMKSVALSQSTKLSLLNRDGSILGSTIQADTPESITHSGNDSLKNLYANPMKLSTYMSSNDKKVVGVFALLPHLSWGILMEKDYDLVFAEVLKLKNITLIIIAILLTVTGIAAFFLSYSILSPLKRLIKGAGQVADGDLNVKLPVKNKDELGFTISVFNDMVVRLRNNHDELEMLATVDSLTGLTNRKHLMDTLALHMKRYARHRAPFSILMADLDHFKQVNDNYGHLAGDAVLRKVGKIFNETLRSIDTAGRYGGEEFLIILDNTGEQEAEQTAERIRKAVEESRITRDGKTIQVTISIGVATICDMVSMDDGQLIGIADKALYEAKQQGRNRIVVATIKSSE
jgi:diguanylate cyclase (GGDEF)-like protein